MATVTQSPITVTQANKVWRKVQGDIGDGIQYECEEWNHLDDIKDAEYDWSLREVTAPVDILEDGGVASIEEGAMEAVASIANAEEISVAPIFLNKRFEASRFLFYIDKNGGDTQVRKQLKHSSLHAIRAMARQFSDYFYGTSTAVLALTDTDLAGASTVLTLKDAYERTDIDTAAFIADKFRVNERVAVLNAGTRVTNAVGKITAISKTTPSITVTWDGTAPSETTNGLQIVKANSLDNTKDDFNRGLVGLMDGLFTASVHGISNATVDAWKPALTDTTGGRFSGVRYHKAVDEIHNKGGGTVRRNYMAQGVYRDMIGLYQASLRFSDAFALEIDGDIKAGKSKFFKSRRVPPKHVVPCDPSGLQKWMLLPKPDGTMRWGDGKEREDRSAFVFRIDMPIQLIWKNRAKFAVFTALDEQ
jgi:hypothetical protein